MRIHEIITESNQVAELFQPGKEWQWTFRGSEEAAANFEVGNVPYLFHAFGTDGEWEVEFKREGSKLDRANKFGLTGTGNSAEVMSTVVDIMRSFLEQYKDKIEQLTFSAKEDSRRSLYAKMVKRLLPDWHMTALPNGSFILYNPSLQLEESYQLDEGLGDWIYKKIDDLLGMPKPSADQVSRAMARAPANLPDDIAEKLVADFLAKKQHEAALERAAQAQRTTVEKLKPYLMYFVGEFVDRWKRIPQADKQRALKDLALSVFRLLMFILEALIKSRK